MSSNRNEDRRLQILAILSCLKTVSAVNSYLKNGDSEKAKNVLDTTISELKKVRENIALLKEKAVSTIREIHDADLPEDRHINIVLEFSNELKKTILTNPVSARVCIRIQPHLEVMFNTLSNLLSDLRSRNKAIRRAAFRDTKVYLSYIESYLTDLLRVLNNL
jgi:hypothetical protein